MTTLQSWRKPNPHKPTFSEVPEKIPATQFFDNLSFIGTAVALSAHPFVDNSVEKLALIRSIFDGVPNPYVMGVEGYRRFERMYIEMYRRSLKNPGFPV